jgi:hypothetical protein
MWDDNKTLGISKRWHSVLPPLAFDGNHNMRNIMEFFWQNRWINNLMMGKCEDRQRKSCIIESNCKHSKGGYGRQLVGNVYTCHGFF